MRNYGGQGWEGSKYQKTENLDVVEIAKLVKKEAQTKFPTLTISVSTQKFAGGCSIEVRINNVDFEIYSPEFKEYNKGSRDHFFEGEWYNEKAKEVLQQLKSIVNQYRYNDSNGMIDYFDTNFYSGVDYAYKLQQSQLAN